MPAYLKLENIQPSGSFKIRGISNLVLKSMGKGVKKIVSSSGGNAGMATAHVGNSLGIPTTVVIPESTPKFMKQKLEESGAAVEIFGSVWNEAHERALELSNEDGVLYVPPYDHSLIWEGVGTIVKEITEECPQNISAIVLAVGGGGLLCGVLEGLLNIDLSVPVIAMETEGAHCLNMGLEEGQPIMLKEISSVAKSLGALSVAPRVFELLPESNIISQIVTDKEAVRACLEFIDDTRYLVEPACGAALSAGYSGIIQLLIQNGKIQEDGAIVFIVCGGNVINLELLQNYKKSFSL